MSSITNYRSQCSFIPLCPVLQTTAASAISSPYLQYYKLLRPVQYHPLMSSITNYSSQCNIIPLSPVLQTTAASAVSSPYVQYYKLQQPVQYHPPISSITNYRSQCFIIPLCQVLQTTAASAVSSPVLQNIAYVSCSFISHYSTVNTNITFSPSAQSYSHTVGLHADTQQCLLLLNTHLLAG